MIRTTLVLALPLLMAGCAQVKEPQGGPKDTAPPALLDASPAYGSTQFTGNRIVLRFDERVKLDRVRERLLVSPPLALPP
ncbi:MAG TPA: Ig-like domain-containing protein, partial [Flavobacteriales bacterium]|nr:Ig-like domain-containing protein [Flavobacteriales bacterium]